MHVYLMLVFMLLGSPREITIEAPSLSACSMRGQFEAREWLKDHPKYSWDGTWKCRLGGVEKSA